MSKQPRGDLTKEYFDEKEIILEKGKQLAELIRKSKHFVIFTGAGVSTEAGIPDYRGPEGAWTRAAKGLSTSGKSMFKVLPTYTHMAIVELFRAGYAKHLITQNCDSLHRRSGLRSSEVSALHGTVYTERCLGCEVEYLRDFNTCNNQKMKQKTKEYDHRTGRKCEGCGGVLYDTIINFGEYLHPKILGMAEKNAEMGDLCLAMGSSLTVTPACNLPLQVKKNNNNNKVGKYCIINLQKTPHDRRSDLRIFAKVDDVMKVVMDELELKPQPYVLKRKIRISSNSEKKKIRIIFEPLDFLESKKFDFVKEVWVKMDSINNKDFKKLSPPFIYECDGDDQKCEEVILFFYSHYEEPPISFKGMELFTNTIELDLHFSPYTNLWEVLIAKEQQQQQQDCFESYENLVKREVNLEIGNSSHMIDEVKKIYEWEVFVREEEKEKEDIDIIDFVEFKLHWSYKPNEIVVRKKPFVVKNQDRTTSKIDIRIYYKKSKRISNVMYFLSFSLDSNNPVLKHKESV